MCVLQEVVILKKRAQPIGNILRIILDHLKYAKTVNRLLRAAEEALIDGSDKHLEIVQEIRQDHLNAARSVIENKEILDALESQLEKECLKLRSFLEAAEVG